MIVINRTYETITKRLSRYERKTLRLVRHYQRVLGVNEWHTVNGAKHGSFLLEHLGAIVHETLRLWFSVKSTPHAMTEHHLDCCPENCPCTCECADLEMCCCECAKCHPMYASYVTENIEAFTQSTKALKSTREISSSWLTMVVVLSVVGESSDDWGWVHSPRS